MPETTRRAGHRECPSCTCGGPYGDHCQHEHNAWLSVRDLMMLEMENRRYGFPGAKEQDIRHIFGMGATRYYQALNVLIDREAALEHDPLLVRRLRRLRAARQSRRRASPGVGQTRLT